MFEFGYENKLVEQNIADDKLKASLMKKSITKKLGDISPLKDFNSSLLNISLQPTQKHTF